MDIKDRVMGGTPHDFFHKLASIVPGYQGYVDRERRRDADKILRMSLARQYSAQRDRLTRVEQSLLRSHQMNQIGEVERLSGILQRFIDRLSTATYGYTGLFDPVKIEAADLDQLYAFDMALASGVDQLSSAIGSVESAAGDASGQELPAALGRLEGVVDELNTRLTQRTDFLSTGQRLPDAQYQSLVNDLTSPESAQPPTQAGMQAGEAGAQVSPYASPSPTTTGMRGTVSETNPTMPIQGAPQTGEVARYGGGDPMDAGVPSPGNAGEPTTNLSPSQTLPPVPGVSSMSEGNQGFSDQPTDVTMGNEGPGEIPTGGTAGTGVETASSPAAAPGAPGHDVVDGMAAANNMGAPTGTGSDTGGILGSTSGAGGVDMGGAPLDPGPVSEPGSGGMPPGGPGK